MKGRADRTAAVHVPRPSCRLGRGVFRQLATRTHAPDARPVQPAAGVSTGDVRHPPSINPRTSPVLALVDFRRLVQSATGGVPTGDGRRLRRVSVQDTGGPGEPTRSGRADRHHTPHLRAGRPSKGTLAGSGRGTSPSFSERFGDVARFAYLRGVVGMTSYDFPRGKVSASTPPGALSASLAFCLLRAQKGGTGRPRVAPVPGRKARVPATRPGFRPETKDQP